MKIDHLSLLTSLFAIINENNQEDSFFILANYFLDNYSKLAELNIYEVADECYVSRSSVRRFCQFIGYDNFKNLKDIAGHFNEEYEYYLIPYDIPDYRENLKFQIDNMFKEMDQWLDSKKIGEMVDLIHASRHVVFLASDTMTSRLKDFQRSLLLYGKKIRLISDMFMDSKLMNVLDERDCLITISPSGEFAYAARNFVKESQANKILITVSRNTSFSKYYDNIYYLCGQDYTRKSSVYAKYGIDCLMDLVFSSYIKKYKNDLKYKLNLILDKKKED